MKLTSSKHALFGNSVLNRFKHNSIQGNVIVIPIMQIASHSDMPINFPFV